jgi:hypothetical protein
MRWFFGAMFAAAFLLVPARADDKDVKSILDKAANALGGEEKLAKVDAFSYKGKGTVNFNGNENEFDTQITIKGLDHYRREFGNDQFSVVVVLADTKGWRKFGDDANELDDTGIANEKRNVYLQVIPITLVAVKGRGFKVESAAEQ